MSPDDIAEEQIEAGDYLAVFHGDSPSLWHFDGTRAARVGLAGSERYLFLEATDLETFRLAIERHPMTAGQSFIVCRLQLPPGCYHPRIARPSVQPDAIGWGTFPLALQIDQPLVSALNQLRTLLHMLDGIFAVIHPVEANLRCFGAEIRNLLMLACTECETLWRGTLTANGYPVTERASTNDFVKLLRPMRLDEYAVRFQRWPWLTPASPFARWNSAAASKSLEWYADYNASKHDREANMERATISASLHAVAAVFIMIGASYGATAIRHFDDVDRFFDLVQAPRWLGRELYCHPYPSSTYKAVPLF
ncbi:hypothetical protein [Sphingomonas sp.]|uniref:hypothetical protein n=1 Tax=Sphingomonas sp. TaxID=28214 RepID=UPI0028A8C227|nr:hypothetical protein [Sphingomonas sp.]